MHTGFITLLIAVGWLNAFAASTQNESLEQLIARAAHDQQAEAYADVTRREVEVANQFFTTGEVEKAQAAVKNAVAYAEKALEAARKSHKKLKETDLILYRASRRLNDVRLTLAFDDRPPVADAVDRIEKIRLQVLDLLFAPPGHKHNP